ncbi:glycosyltransferase [Salimicrobium sp. PL1-032A]|uniref:glycosyltransferase n=1 Tax=Salimicrobium sp. PL1-032A TaxID=3095364 RepID=UPI0032607A01
MKKKVLIMTEYYYPSVKAGGPVQSIRNIVENLSNEYDFYIVTSDRDLRDNKPFNEIKIGKWSDVGEAKVFYGNFKKINLYDTLKILKSIDFDIIYINSLFSSKFSVKIALLIKAKIVSFDNVVLAPRGELSKGALSLKKYKKLIFLNLAKLTFLYNKINWHATAQTEKKDIIKHFGEKSNIFVAENMTRNYDFYEFPSKPYKYMDEVKLVFISRIHPKKNLITAIKALEGLKGIVVLDIYGPLEDEQYWDECLQIIEKLNSNITVNYQGILKNSEVVKTFEQYHFFIFPTLGENYGHVISESLMGGCPVITSDQTPWEDLDGQGAGWIVDNKTKNYNSIIQNCLDMSNEEYRSYSLSAFNYGLRENGNKKKRQQYLKMFENK